MQKNSGKTPRKVQEKISKQYAEKYGANNLKYFVWNRKTLKPKNHAEKSKIINLQIHKFSLLILKIPSFVMLSINFTEKSLLLIRYLYTIFLNFVCILQEKLFEE